MEEEEEEEQKSYVETRAKNLILRNNEVWRGMVVVYMYRHLKVG